MIPPWLSVIGIGEDGVEGLSHEARRLVAGATLLVGGARHLAMVDCKNAVTMRWTAPLDDALGRIHAARGTPVVVLASGDPFCFGIGSVLLRVVKPEEMRVIPAVSSVTLACARLGWARQDVSVVSLCGRPLAPLRPLLQPGARILALSSDETTPRKVADWLVAHGFGSTRLHILEALGGVRERCRSLKACDAVPDDIARLNLLGLEIEAGPNARSVPLASGLDDGFFEHDGQLTKREIRAATLSALAPRVGEILWDLGAGAGSIAIEWMLRHPSCRACAVERDPLRVARIARNAEALGVPSLQVLERVLPSALDDLPRPDAVFVGGGVGREGVLECGWNALRPGGRLVANAVTLEGEARLFRAFQNWGGALSRIQIERLGTVGGLHCFRPAITVTQYVVVKA